MAEYGNFESVWDKEIARKQLKIDRNALLEEAKHSFEHKQWKAEQAKKRGEGTWMLPELAQTIPSQDSKKKKKKKEKKAKKSKKKKKKKDKGSSGSDSESAQEDEWIEKDAVPSASTSGATVKGPQLQRDSWMMDEGLESLFGGESQGEKRAKREKEKEEKARMELLLSEPGKHELELNPYWKATGTGLPGEKEEAEKEKQSTGVVGGVASQGALDWLRKALKRCEDQALEEERSLEEIAAERYGSLEELKEKIKNAEEALMYQQSAPRRQFQRPGFQRPGERDDYDRKRYRSTSRERKWRKSRSTSRERRRSKDRNRLPERRRSKDNNRSPERRRSKDRKRSPERRRSYDRNRSPEKKSRDRRKKSRSRSESRPSRSKRSQSSSSSSSSSRSKSRERRKGPSRSRSRSNDRRKRRSRSSSKSNDRKRRRSRSRSNSRERRKRRSRSRSNSRERRKRRSRSRSNSRERRNRRSRSRDRRPVSDFAAKMKSRFKKPGEEEEMSYSRSSKSTPSWRKPNFAKPEDNDDRREKDVKAQKGKNTDSSRDSRHPKPAETKAPSKPPPSSSSSSSSESSESEEEEIPVEPLTEQEMNELGAKIVRAEIMGNQVLAEKLKSELEAGRNAASAKPKESKPRDKREKQDKGEENNLVLLTQTTKKGIVRPLGEEGNAPSEGGKSGSRRRKRKMATHDRDGERVRYFADDDRHDLKSLVEQEKMGTAEDSNMMFARLAGRSSEKADDDHQLDDIMLNKATKASKTVEDERERARAIMEHKQNLKRMEKCSYCFENVSKHLIIAIGLKCYLSLPGHTSLTEGHCLITPMQHVANGTAADEDVWEEVQIFRKILTKMFLDRDEDVVFMETCMNLQRHMAIEVVPVPKEIGDMAPIYFKKAIDDCEEMWADNKKLVDLRNKDIRSAVPKGFPYFSVDFGLQGGFAHVIEDAKTFSSYFGREIVGGMIDADPTSWRKPRKENFDDQRRKVMQFAEMWRPYDWTKKIKRNNSTSSEDSDT